MSEKLFLKPLLFILAAICAVSAFANKVKVLELDGTSPSGKAPQFSVYSSDGETYDTVDVTQTARISIALEAQCRKGARKDKQPYRGVLRIPGFDIVGDVSPPDDLIHSSDRIQAQIKFAGGRGQARALTAWCNNKLDQMLSEQPQRTKYELMAEGYIVEAPFGINADYQLSCLSTGWGKDDQLRSDVLIDASITCESSDLAANKIPSGEITIKPMETIPMVSKVAVKSNAQQFEGNCPVDFYFTSLITATRPGKVTYRFVDERGLASEVLELDFNEPGEQSTRIIRRHLGMLTGQSYTRLLAEGMETVNIHLFKDSQAVTAESTAGTLLPHSIESANEQVTDQSRAVEGPVADTDLTATSSELSASDSDMHNPQVTAAADLMLSDLEWDMQGSMTLEILSPDTTQSEPQQFFANCTK